MLIEGGLISNGPESVDQFRRAAGYVDRILKGHEARRPARAAAAPSTNSRSNLKTAKGAGAHQAGAARERRGGDRSAIDYMQKLLDFVLLLF
jgi:putative ABC transport system substrate-binding protein